MMKPQRTDPRTTPLAFGIWDGVLLEVGEGGDAIVGVADQELVATLAHGVVAQPGDDVVVAVTPRRVVVVAGLRSRESSIPSVRAEGDDLVLRAPKGRVVIEAGSDVEIRTKQTTVQSASIDVTAARASLHVGEATVLADALRTVADEVVTHVGRWELRARRIVEDADVATLTHRIVHHTVDRMRTVAHDALHFFAKRASVVSEEDTTVDGKRVLLG